MVWRTEICYAPFTVPFHPHLTSGGGKHGIKVRGKYWLVGMVESGKKVICVISPKGKRKG